MVNQSSANNNATKSDVNKIVKQSGKVLRQEILRVEERVENIEEGQKRMETTLNKISTQLDGFVGRVDDLTTENVIGTNHMRKIKINVEDHEKRIKALESS